ncbi:MAG: UDP-glucose 4-epimerase GalE [Nitrospirae bacterium GWC2_57_9]|nr:MAG: UDP-glucose 4-epimerase GalE [Nitrospirae bacterium GWC2_57_9]
MSNEKILVTGGAGYIGSHVVRQLNEAGRSVVVFDNLSSGFSDALIHGEELIRADLADGDALENVFRGHRIRTVLHFAASIVAPESVSDPLKYYRNNTSNTMNLLSACIRSGVERFIFSSTAAVYGIPPGGVAGEDSPTVPINPYGSSKLMIEQVLKDVAHAHGLRYVALRYFNAAAADPQGRLGERHSPETHLIPLILQAAKGEREGITVYGTDYPTPDGTCIRDYIHIEDLSAAHLDGLRYLEANGESATLNVGYGRGASVKEVIETARVVTGVNFPVRETARRPGDPPTLIAKADRIRHVLGWKPRYDDLRTIVADAWRWEQKRPGRTIS